MGRRDGWVKRVGGHGSVLGEGNTHTAGMWLGWWGTQESTTLFIKPHNTTLGGVYAANESERGRGVPTPLSRLPRLV